MSKIVMEIPFKAVEQGMDIADLLRAGRVRLAPRGRILEAHSAEQIGEWRVETEKGEVIDDTGI